MADMLPPVIAQLLGDASDAIDALTELQAAINALDGKTIDITVSMDKRGALSAVADVQSAMDSLGSVESSINVSDEDALTKIAGVAAAEKSLGDINAGNLRSWEDINSAILRSQIAVAGVSEKAAQAERNIQNAAAEIDALQQVAEERVQMGIDDANVEAKLAALKIEMGLLKEPVEIPVDVVGAARAAATLASLDATIAGLKAEQVLSGGAVGGTAGKGGGGGLAGLLGLLGFGGGGGGGRFGFLGALPGMFTLGSLMGFGPESLLTTGLGIAGSAAGAGVGAGLLGLGAAGVGAVGMGTDMAGIGQALGDTKQYTQALTQAQAAQAQFNAAVQQFGPFSQQAVFALQNLQSAQTNVNTTLSQFPVAAQGAIAQLGGTVQQFKAIFDAWTGQAEATGANILNQMVQIGERFLPIIGTYAAQNMRIIQSGLQPLLTWIQGPGMSIFTDLEQEFQNQLPTAVHAFSQGLELFLRIVDDASHYTGGLIQTIDRWVTRLNGADWGRVTRAINEAIGVFRVWWGLIKNVGDAIYQLFTHDAGTGTAIIQMISRMVAEFDRWAASVAGGDQLHALLESHKQEILAILSILPHFLSAFGQLDMTLRPALMTLITLLADLANALLSIPYVGQFLAMAAAVEVLGSRISIVGRLIAPFNGLLRSLAIDGLHLVGDVLVALASQLLAMGGPFAALGGLLSRAGGWFQGIGVQAPSAMEAAAASIAESAASIAASMSSIAASARGAAEAVTTSYAELEGLSSEAAAAITADNAEIDASLVTTAGAARTTSAATGSAGLGGAFGSLRAVTGGLGISLGDVGLALGGVGVLGAIVGADIWLANNSLSNTQIIAQNAAPAIDAFNQKLRAMPTGTVADLAVDIGTVSINLAAMNRQLTTGVTQFPNDILKTQGAVLALNTNLNTGYQAIIKWAQGLQGTQHSSDLVAANTQLLSSKFGVLSGTVQDWATTTGQNLNQALNPAQIGQFLVWLDNMGVGYNTNVNDAQNWAGAISQTSNEAASGISHINLLAESTSSQFTQLSKLAVTGGSQAVAKWISGLKGGVPQAEAMYQQLFNTDPQTAAIELAEMLADPATRAGQTFLNDMISPLLTGQQKAFIAAQFLATGVVNGANSQPLGPVAQAQVDNYLQALNAQRSAAVAAGGNVSTAALGGAAAHDGDFTDRGTIQVQNYLHAIAAQQAAAVTAGGNTAIAALGGAAAHDGDFTTHGNTQVMNYLHAIAAQRAAAVTVGGNVAVAALGGASQHDSEFTRKGETHGTAYTGGIDSKDGTATTSGSNLATATTHGLGGLVGAFSLIGDQAVAALNAAINAGISNAADAVSGAVSRFTSMLTNLFHGSPEFFTYHIGEGLASDLAKGFTSAIGPATSIVAKGVTTATQTVTAAATNASNLIPLLPLTSKDALDAILQQEIQKALAPEVLATKNLVGILDRSTTGAHTAFLGDMTMNIPPLSTPTYSGAPQIIQVTTPIQINGQTLAQTVTQYQVKSARSTGNVLSGYAGTSQTAAATTLNVNAIQR